MKNILALSRVYNLFSYIIGADSFNKTLASEFFKVKDGDRILDIGCGTARVLEFLPNVQYTGFDLSPEYIKHAEKRYGSRGTFVCQSVGEAQTTSLGLFDIVLAIGVVHHLNDEEALGLFQLAKLVLKPRGRLVTVDGCLTQDQSVVARYLLSKDRGAYVRWEQDYLGVAHKVFSSVNAQVCKGLLNVPYTHIIMECSAPSDRADNDKGYFV
ncbi:MAG: class I SAM-dependent methyltransferase [Candidatus Aquicultorales bacterium]